MRPSFDKVATLKGPSQPFGHFTRNRDIVTTHIFRWFEKYRATTYAAPLGVLVHYELDYMHSHSIHELATLHYHETRLTEVLVTLV